MISAVPVPTLDKTKQHVSPLLKIVFLLLLGEDQE